MIKLPIKPLVCAATLLTVPACAQAQPAKVAAPSCPATLSPDTGLPAGSRLIGRRPSVPLSLASAIVTNDAPDAADPAQGFAEVEPDDDRSRAGVSVQSFQVSPTPRDPYSLLCRYGRSAGPLGGDAVLLSPLPASTAWDCQVAIPQGRSSQRVSAQCRLAP
jgi:hypothetical protein